MEAVGSKAANDAVVEDIAVLLQHQRVAAAARLQAGEGVGVHAVEELGRVRADDLDLAERGGVEHADARAYGGAFACHGGVHVLAGQREAAGALPQADILEGRTVGNGPIVRRRRAHGIEQRAAARPRERGEGDGRIGRPERRRADLRHGLVERFGDDAQGVHVRRLALVRRHARGGVALHVLDRFEAFAHGEPDVLRRHVVLEVDEGASARPLPAGRMRTGWKPVRGRGRPEPALSCVPHGGRTGAPTFGKTCRQLIGSVALRPPTARPAPMRPARRHRCPRRSAASRATARTSAPPASSRRRGRRSRMAGSGGPDLAAGAHRSHDQAADALASGRSEHGVPGQHLAAGGAQARRPPRRNRLRTQVDDGDIDARGLEIGAAV